MAPKDDQEKSKTLGLSAFASLLDPNSKGVSAEPVLYGQQAQNVAPKAEKSTTSSFAFKPVKRPQVKQPVKPRPSASIIKPPVLYKQDAGTAVSTDGNGPAAATPPPGDASPTAQNQNASHKPTLQDWMDTMPEDEDAAAAYAASKQQNRGGGRNARKRKREQEKAARAAEQNDLTNWKGVYDPSRPNHYAFFKRSDEFYDMVYEWKDHLHTKARAREKVLQRRKNAQKPGSAKQNSGFVPPPGMTFAPSAVYDDDDKAMEDDDEPYEPPPPPSILPANAMSSDVDAQHMAMSSHALPPPPPPAPAVEEDEDMDYEPPSPPRLKSVEPTLAPGSISKEPVRYEVPTPATAAAGSISREPVRYDNAPPPSPPEAEIRGEEPTPQASQPPSKRPGQKDFAKRMMEKMGWQKGSGLGVEGTGIATPLSVQLDKRLKRSSAEGGGFIGPAGKGRVVGGSMSKEGKAAAQREKEEAERIGELSEVVSLDHMLDDQDIENVLTELNFYQALGDECGEKYGRVERIYVEREGETRGRVFVRFVERLSAMRALQAFQGREYGGNVVEARYFDKDKFEKDIMGF